MRRIWRAAVDRIAPYDPGRPLEALASDLGRTDLVRLSANESPLGPSPRVVEAIAREAARVHLYPDGGSTSLREALAARLGVAPAQIVVGNGADELLALIGWAALEPGDSRLTARTKAIVLCSPHNPAGTIIRRAPLTAFLDALGHDAPLTLLDEAYCDFCDDPEYPDGVTLLAHYPRLILLRTFSKIAGLAGLRVGYTVATAEVAERLNRVRAPYNVNRLGQVAALAALEDRAHWERTRDVVIRGRAFLSRELSRRGFGFPPSQANFLLVQVPQASAVLQRLLRAGIIVRDGAAVGFPDHLRIAVGDHAANVRLLEALA
ncbi:MAG: histidinol-phosphate transaminase [Candidatus Rokuibacteriota bacterium]|nr:MAG: histidinol-phosphate transaminase [Candidatus Rokubacteria bacterium]